MDLVRGVLESDGIVVEPVTQADAEAAAALWRVGSGLSLADCLCPATGWTPSSWAADSGGSAERLMMH